MFKTIVKILGLCCCSYSADINSAVLLDVTGRKIMDVVIQNDLINFNSLLEGVYLLQFNTGLVKRILKY